MFTEEKKVSQHFGKSIKQELQFIELIQLSSGVKNKITNYLVGITEQKKQWQYLTRDKEKAFKRLESM